MSKLIIVSGLSGSGKSIALDTLEDCGFYCVDNLPIILLEAFIDQVMLTEGNNRKTAISIDARNQTEKLADFADTLSFIRRKGIECEVVYMQAEERIILKRYSETRRRHPLTARHIPLKEAIDLEIEMLRPLALNADVVIDTSYTDYHDLRKFLRTRLCDLTTPHLAIQLQSFGFKYGIPLDCDFMFDARCLPNPYWVPELRSFSGKEQPIIEFLQNHDMVKAFMTDIADFIGRWVPRFESENRCYLTIAVGCTGGQHRSVYLVEALSQQFEQTNFNVIVRHRELR